MQKLFEKVLKKIEPSEMELRAEEKIAKEIISKIKKIEGKHVDVSLAGSLARHTHLKNDRDLDIFVMFPEHLEREEFEKEGLRIGKLVFKGHKWEEAYSEHPYIRGNIKGFDVEIIPSYKVKNCDEIKSAVDRTPFHNQYLLRKLSEKQKKEARLLKQFLKGIKCYGADLKVSSVPGIVAELLVVKFGTFENVLKNASEWKKGEVIDLENHWGNEIDAVQKKFNHHLIVIDPTDKNRNVAAALSFEQYCRLIAACRAFLKKPSENFFFGKKIKPLSIQNAKKLLEEKDIIAVKIPYPSKALSDIIYGQIKKLTKKISNQLSLNEFEIVRIAEWTDETKNIVLLVELESFEIEIIKKHFGPEVTDFEHQKRFLEENKNIVGGPRIENGRLVVEKRRKFWNAKLFSKDFLKKEKIVEKMPLKKTLSKARILENHEIISFFKQNKKFAEFLTTYLKGKEDFLDY